jgi:hypothetical protein
MSQGNRLFTVSIVASLALLVVSQAPAGVLVFADTEFADADWIVDTVYSYGAGATLATAHSDTGGNPGACQITMGQLHAEPDVPSGIWRVYLDADAVLDPATMEPLESASAAFDVIATGWGSPGAALRLIARQDDQTYGTPWAQILPPRMGWIWDDVGLHFTATDLGLLQQGDFDPLIQPDLSPTGAPLTFGFMLWQELAAGATEAEDTFAVGNWSIQLHLVPEPATSLSVLAAILLIRRRRAAY